MKTQVLKDSPQKLLQTPTFSQNLLLAGAVYTKARKALKLNTERTQKGALRSKILSVSVEMYEGKATDFYRAPQNSPTEPGKPV